MRPQIRALVDRLMVDADDAVVIDFESYYDDVCTVKTLGNYAYFHHPRQDVYLVTIFGRGVDFVGHPTEAPWEKVHGRRWVKHNAGFDWAGVDYLKEINVIPKHIEPLDVVDSADIAVYFGHHRNLAGAANSMFGISLSKATRNTTMKAKYWYQFSDAEKQEVLDYAGDDAIAWAIYQENRKAWPDFERQLAQHTLMSARRGVACDSELLRSSIMTLNQMVFVAERKLPWFGTEDEEGEPIKLFSRAALDRECIVRGVPVPKSTSAKDSDFIEWLDEYGPMIPAIASLSQLRRIKRSLAVFQAMEARLMPNGRIDAGLKYYGAANTGRWAGGSGFNLQNLLKAILFCDAEFNWVELQEDATHVIDVRKCLVAGPGKKLLIPDLSQIEPRVLNWLVGNHEFTRLCAEGQSPYEAHARASMGWTGGSLKKENPKMYALAKARVLALGYGAGFKKFIEMAYGYVGAKAFAEIFEAEPAEGAEEDFIRYLTYLVESGVGKDAKKDLVMFNTELTRAEKNTWVNSYAQVKDFRGTNPLLAGKGKRGPLGIWKSQDDQFRAAAADGYYEIELPSGRLLQYFDVTSQYGWSCRRTRGGMTERTYGGKLTENITQAIARDVFGAAILRLEEAGYPVVFHVHDEAILEVDEHVTIEDVLPLLKIVPEWATGLPVDAEGDESLHYKK